ncbi:hypothetical protein [Mycolicibacterium sp. XJ1819]
MTRIALTQVLEDSVPYLAVTLPTVGYLNPLAPWRYPRYQRPLYSLIHWAVQDLHPRWAQQLMNTPQFTPAGRLARRTATKALLNMFGDGVVKEVRQSRARASAASVRVGSLSGA